ncbi:MAG: SH3 domain-containing protein [Lachnospiraceae bacterium]|nr:SH3 domain-containing protein [uncultured Agathobacter sp.]MDD6137778.1 SH3 domain-containing protein [Lachnospiraceae bacterium]MDY6157393.1 SH3 domain-containing protein [Agathobacter sp.]
MKVKYVKITAGMLTGLAVAGTAPYGVQAAGLTAGVASYTNNVVASASAPTAGVTSAVADVMLKGDETTTTDTDVASNEAETVKSAYADVAIAKVQDYVNVRAENNEDSEVLGKLYNNSAATVLETTDDGWYKISSGSVTGYVKSEYVVVGDDATVKSAGRRVATVNTETLKVRTSADENSEVLGLVAGEDDLTVIDESADGWVGVSTEDGTGYVSSDYVSLDTEFTYAESKEEEAARLAKEEADRKAAAEAAAKEEAKKNAALESNKSSKASNESKKSEAVEETADEESSSSDSSSEESYSAPSGSNGQAVVDYACQFVGNPYVYGGSSLTNGTDCSGFVMSVYAQFGISLPHSSSALRSVGYGVSVDDMQPGDIICYSGHVAIYCGGNTIVHASNPSTGIKYTSPANYKTILAVRRIF